MISATNHAFSSVKKPKALKMKKVLIGLLVLVTIAIIAAYMIVPRVIYSMVTDFEPWTFERVLEDTTWVSTYEIGEYRSPEDYGYDQTEEVTFESVFDKVKLSAWYVPSSGSDSTIVMIHGRTSNRLKTMKYLELFQETGIDTMYNVFIVDMRNSGKSENGMKTYMGYKFAEDIYSSLDYLKREKGQQHFTLYAFSMGAIATYTTFGREDLDMSAFDVNKIIIDSPLSDVAGVLKYRSDGMGLPTFIYDNAIELVAEEIDGYLYKMNMSEQLKGVDIPILVIQSNHDTSTPASYTKAEIEKLNRPSIQTWFMDSAEHVRIFKHPEYNRMYTQKVSDFLRN